MQRARPRPRLEAYVCPTCRHAAQRRAVSTTFLNRKAEGREQWAAWARQIRAGKRASPLAQLEARGFVHDITGERADLDALLTEKRVGVYCGIDPTAPSLHIGHMLPLMALFWMHVNGFHTVSLLGAQTARIGDPTGRSKDRPEMTNTERKANLVGLHYQVKKLWSNLEVTAKRHGFGWEKHWHREIANNATWWNRVPFVDVLKYLGKGLRMGELLKRDTARSKLESGDGMSLAEFCYPVMQAWDWWHMYDTKDVQMQIGGADQYGNIVAGVDAIKYIAKTHPDPDTRQEEGVSPLTTPYGLTVPLLTTASGDKFGKSAGNAVWLEENMTSLFDLYAFFVKTADADVERFLKLFTFLSLDKIAGLMAQHSADTSKRLAQRVLAFEFVHLVHGQEKATLAQTQYDKRAESRNTASLSSLMTGSESPAFPSPHTREPLAPPPVPENPLSHKTYLGQRVKATFTSPSLNPYAPTADPNKPSGNTQHIVLPASLIKDVSIAKVLYSAGLVTSRSEGHRLTLNGGAYIGRQSDGKQEMTDALSFIPAKLQDPHLTWSNVIRDHASGAMDTPGEEGVLILRSGKWKVRVVRVVSDEKFEELGLPDPPGWQEFKSVVAARTVADRLDEAPIPEPGHSVNGASTFSPPPSPSRSSDGDGKIASSPSPDIAEWAPATPTPTPRSRALDDEDDSDIDDDGGAFPESSSSSSRTRNTYDRDAPRGRTPRAPTRPSYNTDSARGRTTRSSSYNDRDPARPRSSYTNDKYNNSNSSASRRGSPPRVRDGMSPQRVARLQHAKRAAVQREWRAGSDAVRARRDDDLARSRRRERARMQSMWTQERMREMLGGAGDGGAGGDGADKRGPQGGS